MDEQSKEKLSSFVKNVGPIDIIILGMIHTLTMIASTLQGDNLKNFLFNTASMMVLWGGDMLSEDDRVEYNSRMDETLQVLRSNIPN